MSKEEIIPKDLTDDIVQHIHLYALSEWERQSGSDNRLQASLVRMTLVLY